MAGERPDFEQDQDLGFTLANDPGTGAILANAVKAETFDPRHVNDIEGLLFLVI